MGDNTKAQRSRRRKAGSSHRHGDRTAWESANGRGRRNHGSATRSEHSKCKAEEASGRWQRAEGGCR